MLKTKVLRVQDGNYKVVVGGDAPGKIILDTSPSSNRNSDQGEVLITGDLKVLGKSTIVQSETLEIKDNIIYLNSGETGDGVTLDRSGIQIDRGNPVDGRGDVQFVFDETIQSRDPVSGSLTFGTFVFKDNNPTLTFRPIATNSINSNGGNLSLIGQGTGVITVTGTVDYEEQVLNYVKINTSFDISTVSRNSSTGISTVTLLQAHGLQIGDRVDIQCGTDSSFNKTFAPILNIPSPFQFTYSNPGINVPTKPVTGTVKPNPIIDDDIIPNIRAVSDLAYNALSSYSSNQISEADTKVQVSDVDVSGVSEITFNVDGGQRAVINSSGLTVDRIRVRGDNIVNISNDNILFDSVLNIPNRLSTPTTPVGYVKLYSKNIPGTGDTGLFYVNTQGTSDELISKTRALLFSLIL